MERLSLILWQERELLDTLLYKLEVEQMVLSTGRTRWLLQAAKDVEAVVQTIRETEILRAVAADEAAAQIGLTHNPSLTALAEAAEEPWRSIMLEHRDAFEKATAEVTALADTNRELITAGFRSARETLLSMHEDPAGYSQDGTVVVGAQRPQLFDRSL